MARIDAIGLHRPPELLAPSAAKPQGTRSTQFADALADALGQSRRLAFSAHASQRLEQRGIELGPDARARLEQAVDDAARKGTRQALLILDSTALVVSVANRTVITVMEPNPAENTVITNVDSVVVVGE